MKVSGYFIGLDLGQVADYSALAILERQNMGDACMFNCRHLQRWPLKTSYPSIVADTLRIIGSAEIAGAHLRTLVVDATGVGAPVIDLFKREKMPAKLEPVQITGGTSVSREDGTTRVPKRELVSVTQLAFQNGRLKIAPELSDAQTLVRELENFKVKINLETAHDSYGSWRDGAHDDLVLAVALALWFAAKPETVRRLRRNFYTQPLPYLT
jgi:hypothetical protein